MAATRLVQGDVWVWVVPRTRLLRHSRKPYWPMRLSEAIKRHFSFNYDPSAGEAGRVTLTLEKDSFKADLTKEQRQINSVFDRFGLLNPRKGGKYVDVYVDDLTYVVKRPADFKPIRHQQETIVLPYPKDGRLYK